jgi:hypothetical protein
MPDLTMIDGGLESLDLSGFNAGAASLPAERTDVAEERRHRAALLVLAIGRGYAPEDLADGVPADALQALGDELERAEALAHVDVLLGVLAPRVEVAR